MAQRYSVQELLYLRESPLVKKPDNLPPSEQWMGQQIDPNQRRPPGRHKSEDVSTNEYEKRPNLLDTHITRRSATAAENIVLGPPKTAFASSTSTRTLGKTTSPDSNETSTIQSAKSFGKEGDGDGRDSERRGGRIGGINGRRGDRDDWNNRPRRTFDDGDNNTTERRPRREGHKWETKGARAQDGDDDPKRDAREEGRYGQKQSQGRARFEQPWFRGDNAADNHEDSSRGSRQKGWGRDRRSGAEHESEWHTRTEQDPEWMEAAEPEGQKQAHTAEDFQKWKDRMKAENDKRTSAPDIQQPLQDMVLEEAKKPTNKPTLNIKPETDKFFEFYGEKKATDESVSAAEAKKQKTRFAAFFSPPAEPPNSAVEFKPENVMDLPPARPASTDADQAGFQRILAMLGGKAPKVGDVPMDAMLSSKSLGNRADQPNPNPLAGLFGSDQFLKMATKGPEPKSRGHSAGLESLMGPRSPKATSEKQNDSDFLLRLMQQSKASSTSPQPLPNKASQSAHTPGILQIPESLNRTRHPMKSPNDLPSFFDEGKVNPPQQHPGRQEGQGGRLRYGPYSQMENDGPYERYAPRQEFASHQPPPMPRPPGLEGPPPPGWPGYQHQFQPPQQHQQPPGVGGHIHAPPGSSNPGGQGPSFHGPPMPYNMNMPPNQPPGGPPPPQERQRKYTGGGVGQGGPPFLGSSMPPPPGFLNMPGSGGGGPPPGFPPMPMSVNDQMFGMGQRGGVGGPPMGGGGMPPQNLMELFAMAGDRGPGGGPGVRDGRGPGANPGPYR